MPEQIKNTASSTLAAAIGSGDGTLTVATGTGANFPGSGNFRLVIDSEILLCTARSGDTLTVTRAAESTVAASHAQGATVTLILTAGGLTQFISDQVAADGISKPSGIVSGETAVWNGISWDRSSVTRIGASSLGSGAASSTTFLRGDGTWATPPSNQIAHGKNFSNVSTSGTTFAAGADLLAAPLSFTADGVSDYILSAYSYGWSTSSTLYSGILHANLDGADAGEFAASVFIQSGAAQGPIAARTVLTAPAAGSHTVNVRARITGSATLTVYASGGGAGTLLPILVTIDKA